MTLVISRRGASGPALGNALAVLEPAPDHGTDGPDAPARVRVRGVDTTFTGVPAVLRTLVGRAS